MKLYLEKIELELTKLRSNSTEFLEGNSDKLPTVKQLRDDSNIVHVQELPSLTWVINHNSNRIRTVETFTEGGMKMTGDVQIIDQNTTIVYFLIPKKVLPK